MSKQNVSHLDETVAQYHSTTQLHTVQLSNTVPEIGLVAGTDVSLLACQTLQSKHSHLTHEMIQYNDIMMMI